MDVDEQNDVEVQDTFDAASASKRKAGDVSLIQAFTAKKTFNGHLGSAGRRREAQS
jgi:hypothetical protein